MGDFFELAGGVGLFLFGMHVMTAALRDLAGPSARDVVARFTRTPLSGAVSGALSTAALQSSTATMVTTIGFVGAGLMTFAQALGVIFGTSAGTTITGWMVVLLGFTLQVTALAMPLLLVAALVRLFGRGRTARAATAVAGLCLLFIGIALMQDGLNAWQGRITPASFPADTLAGRVQLIAIGIAVTMVTQSSSAGVVMTLVLLGGGAIGFGQAAALVIGMQVGTAVTTSLLTSVGGARAVRQTAVANVIYHAASGLVGLAMIDAVAALEAGGVLAPEIALVVFHTGFNLVGTAAMLPLTGRFAALVERLVPEHADAPPSAKLDRRLLAEPGAALDTAAAVIDATVVALFAALEAALARGDVAALAAARERLAGEIAALQDFLAEIAIDEDRIGARARYAAVLHQLDHLRRLHFRSGQSERLCAARRDPWLRRPAALLRECLARHAVGREPAARLKARLSRLEARLTRLEARLRQRNLRRPPRMQGMTASELFLQADTLRWARRSTRHVQRILHYRDLADGDGMAPDPAHGDDPDTESTAPDPRAEL